MKYSIIKKIPIAILLSVLVSANSLSADESLGTADVNFNLRYESVEQNNALQDADALTLRTRLTYTFKEKDGFSALVEFEDSRNILGITDYNNTLGQNAGVYSVIADPETTELDQAFVHYKRDGLKIKAGRQVITYDGHRFVGHVGWRQDRQTFDGLTINYKASDDLILNYANITQRNRIFAEVRDLESEDHLFNLAYTTAIGKVTGYGYLLEVDDETDNGIDTYGISLKGSFTVGETKTLYHAEFARQSAIANGADFDADYLFIEGGAVFGGFTTKIGYEVLGSDSGNYGFATPLATLHKFNGFTDQFLATPDVGLVDVYATFATSALGAKWTLTYHDFSADESSTGIDDLGSEVNLVVAKKFSKRYTAGFKYGAYSAGDAAAGKVDTDKIWIWLSAQY
ncbi:hypothetical protein FLL45_02520 [Aliikangiella marina]|uniref:Alginate export domain-containing protein n=1 Tax=Aliikangiella marina TaxID=1712262 RepID=A0A545THZ4_9GAMM|nr:alginate export family protein [Aliikangiella marina]TQV76850.1 hypothetical protein FLL45_02520 [Aliikangiella marina]